MPNALRQIALCRPTRGQKLAFAAGVAITAIAAIVLATVLPPATTTTQRPWWEDASDPHLLARRQAVARAIWANPDVFQGKTRDSWIEMHLVIRVIDGDTIELESGEVVRLADVDCFEIRRGKRAEAQAKKAGISVDEVIRRGKIEADALRKRLKATVGYVALRFSGYPRDPYGRVLATIR